MIKKLQLLGLFLLVVATAHAQTVTGRVTSASDGSPVPGASVVVKGTTTGTASDGDGNFSLSVPNASTDILVVSFIGFKSLEVAVQGRAQVDISLEEDIASLSEVVVTALGIERDKKSLGYFVQEVNGQDLVAARETNFLNNLSGKVAGVSINKTGNGPGGTTGISIRGGGGFLTGSVGRNQPLFVVDGVPVDNYQTATGTSEYGAGDGGNGAQHINPDDIETMSILKGPEAAALYGNRGLTGVILITTKKGKAGKGLGVSYNGSFTFENPLVYPEMQNQYAQGANGGYLVTSQSSWGPKITGQNVTDWTGETNPLTSNPDDLKDFLNTGKNFVHSFDISGGSDKATFRLGYSNMDASGILPNTGVKRNMLTVRTSAKLTDKFSADVKLSYTNEKAKNRPSVSGSPSNVFAQYITRPRNIQFEHLAPGYDVDGNMINWMPTAYTTIRNPYWTLYRDRNEDKTDRVFSMVKLDYKFTPWLKAFVRHGMDFRSSQAESINAYGISSGSGTPNFGSNYNANQTRNSESNLDFLVTASKTFGEFNVALNVGGNDRHNIFFNSGGNTGVLDLPGVYNLSYGSFNRPYSFKSESRVRSIYAFANLSYKDFLFLDLTFRNDWSSTLHPDVRSFNYPSASVSFVLSEAVTLPEFISFAKLRAAATQGASDLSPYQLNPTYNIGRGFLNVISTSTPSTLFDEKIKPEFVKSGELGLDLKFLNNRIGVEAAYFTKDITDQILDLPVPPASGYNFKKVNAGKVKGNGFELTLLGTPVKTSDLNWDAMINFSTNKTRLIDLVPGVERLFLQDDVSSRAIRIVADEGELIGDIYGRDFARDDDGNILVDANGVPVKGSEKNTYLGNTQQKFQLGFFNSISYKGINMSFLIDWRQGGKFFSQSNAWMYAAGTAKGTLAHREGGLIVDGVKQSDGTPNNVEINAQQYWNAVAGAEPVASLFIYDATSIRLRELTITYSFPQSIVGKTPLKRMSVGLTGRNLWLIKSDVPGIDPETSFNVSLARGWENGAYPSTRVLGFNINLGF